MESCTFQMKDVVSQSLEAEVVAPLLLDQLHKNLPADMLIFGATTDCAAVLITLKRQQNDPISLDNQVEKSMVRDHMQMDWIPCAAHCLNSAIGDSFNGTFEQCTSVLIYRDGGDYPGSYAQM